MKRILWVGLIVLALAAVAYAADQWGDYEFQGSLYGKRSWIPDGYPKYINGTAKDTTGPVDFHMFSDIVSFTRRIDEASSSGGAGDSARLHIYLQESLDGDYWLTVDSAVYYTSVDTGGVFKNWTPVPGLYARFIYYCANAANCSVYVAVTKHLLTR